MRWGVNTVYRKVLRRCAFGGGSFSGFTCLAWLVAVLMSPLTQATSDTVILRLNGVEISQRDVLGYVRDRVAPTLYESALNKPEAVANTVRNLYVLKRAHQAALNQGLVDPSELVYEADKAAERLAVKRFREAEIGKQIESADWESLAEEHYLATLPPNEDIREVRVEHILIDFEGRAFDDFVARVNEIRGLIDSGERFSALAVQFSDDDSVKSNLGDLGFIRRGKMHPSFERAAFGLSEDMPLSEPIFTPFGAHLIHFIDERRADVPSFASQKSAIVSDLQANAKSQLTYEIFAPFRKEVDPVLTELDQAAIAADLLASLQDDNN